MDYIKSFPKFSACPILVIIEGHSNDVNFLQSNFTSDRNGLTRLNVRILTEWMQNGIKTPGVLKSRESTQTMVSIGKIFTRTPCIPGQETSSVIQYHEYYNAIHSSEPVSPDYSKKMKLMLSGQLQTFKIHVSGQINGKVTPDGKPVPDDLATAFLFNLYWMWKFDIIIDPIYKTFKDMITKRRTSYNEKMPTVQDLVDTTLNFNVRIKQKDIERKHQETFKKKRLAMVE